MTIQEADWTQVRLQSLIDAEVEENLRLEYKGAGALDTSTGKKREVAKDVSALANSSGGVIIYGIAESDSPERRHLPDRLDPIRDPRITREWLDQVINSGIQPRIDGVRIVAVRLQDGTCFVVDVPQSTTAHQSADKRYYKRFNFESIPMEDYEVRDVMGRQRDPEIDLSLWIEKREQEVVSRADRFGLGSPGTRTSTRTEWVLRAALKNVGTVRARHVLAEFEVPSPILAPSELENQDGPAIYLVRNTHRDVVDVGGGAGVLGPFIYKYGPSWYEPLFAGCEHLWSHELTLAEDLVSLGRDTSISWTVYADNARSRKGETRLSDLLAAISSGSTEPDRVQD